MATRYKLLHSGNGLMLDQTTPQTVSNGAPLLSGGVDVGDGTNDFKISSAGIATLAGTAKRSLTIRPSIDTRAQIAQAKPTQASVGIVKGYSMPIYNNDDEELFFASRVPYRWDGVSDIEFRVFVALSGAEDVGDNLKFRLSWENNRCGGVLKTTSNDVDVEQSVLVSHSAQYSIYCLTFVINYDIDGAGNEILPRDMLNGRLRRIDATNPDVSNEIIVCDWALVYQIDKLYGIKTAE